MPDRGQAVSEIARRLGHVREPFASTSTASRAPGQSRPHADSFTPYAGYVQQRAGDDRHLRAADLHREVTPLGYACSYSAFTRKLSSLRNLQVMKPSTFAPQTRNSPASLC